MNVEEVEKTVRESFANGIIPRALVVINPGNPTGQVLSRENIEDIVRVCHKYSIMILADEVYQNNVYAKDKKFMSVRKVLNEMGDPYRSDVEVISMHSVSKGLLGECGLRGGYMETHNLSARGEAILYKLKSIELCSNTVGQMAVNLMVDPPKRGRESDACVDHYQAQNSEVYKGLCERADLLSNSLNEMKNISCTPIEGAMYGFPSVHFSQKFIEHAKSLGKKPDFLYCMDMVEKTGIMTVPGSGFGQRDGSYHFRITNLVNPTSAMQEVLDRLNEFNNEWQSKN